MHKLMSRNHHYATCMYAAHFIFFYSFYVKQVIQKWHIYFGCKIAINLSLLELKWLRLHNSNFV